VSTTTSKTLAELVQADEPGLARAVVLLTAGELVAFPTETVYGLGARADDAAAIERVYEAKGRPRDLPLIVHVTGVAAAKRVVADWPDDAESLAQAFWPGPLTLVLPRAPSGIVDAVTAGGSTVAVRAPAHPVAVALLERCDFAVAAPSANPYGAPPPTTAGEVLRCLGERISLVIDGGPSRLSTPSTIVALGPAGAQILRQGSIEREAIARIVRLA
jgi:L-threonylcarbamoyladenylate synthase